jgi:hypothetical protein
VSVFLRWGIFGILGFAGLMYAYNASKQMAAHRAARALPPAVEAARPPEPRPQAPASSGPASAAINAAANAPPHCEAELVVAQRALAARAEGQPLDRLLRIQEIAFQEPVRRQRLEKVATVWFQYEGPEPAPEALRLGVIGECVKASPAP